MKKIDLKEIKNLEIKDLKVKVNEAKSKMAGFFMARSESSKGSKDVKQIFKKRKDIAKMLTILRQKELVEELSVKNEELGKESRV